MLSTLLWNLQKGSLMCKEHGTIHTCCPLLSSIRLSILWLNNACWKDIFYPPPGTFCWALQKFGNWKGKFNELKLNLNVQCIDVCHIKWCQRNVVFYMQEAWGTLLNPILREICVIDCRFFRHNQQMTLLEVLYHTADNNFKSVVHYIRQHLLGHSNLTPGDTFKGVVSHNGRLKRCCTSQQTTFL